MRDQQLAFRTNKRKRNQSAVFSPSLALAIIYISLFALAAGWFLSFFIFFLSTDAVLQFHCRLAQTCFNAKRNNCYDVSGNNNSSQPASRRATEAAIKITCIKISSKKSILIPASV